MVADPVFPETGVTITEHKPVVGSGPVILIPVVAFTSVELLEVALITSDPSGVILSPTVNDNAEVAVFIAIDWLAIVVIVGPFTTIWNVLLTVFVAELLSVTVTVIFAVPTLLAVIVYVNVAVVPEV
jgi:acyl-CoA synthetase (AMP-forming)/AMP-acid ligase II